MLKKRASHVIISIMKKARTMVVTGFEREWTGKVLVRGPPSNGVIV